ncbi:MAG TPA: hypothetical protein VHL80_05260, partial [Polyangia bacterium]|nr:hypothetical protein [Polyangia bacterium]
MTSRRSLPRRSSGSRAALVVVARAALVVLARAALVVALTAAAAGGEEAGAPLVERREGVEIDWRAGTLTANGGSAADLHMPGAEVARAGSVRRAQAAARD